MRKIIVSPSLLSADFNKLKEDIEKAESGGAEFLHFDVMDGHFVPNISFGIPVLKCIAKSHHMVNDVHIMISDPLKYSPSFIKAGADIVTFHYEACNNDEEVKEVIRTIHKNGAKAGLSIKPGTPVSSILPFMEELELVLVMSVEPGFGGQSFIESSLEKISILRQFIDDNSLKTLIEVDGGINEITGKACVKAGVDVLVAGSYLFGHEDIATRIEGLKK